MSNSIVLPSTLKQTILSGRQSPASESMICVRQVTTQLTSPISNITKDYAGSMKISEFQQLMADIYGARDSERGVPATVAWLAEEVGELAKATRKGSSEERLHESGDVLAWLASLANQIDVDLEEAAARFANGCPRCGVIPCGC